MVKITNQLGDVKTGRQGEAVYQRKYGEQIRRTASPKRAIPSQSQIAHRQLYRAALTWRSQLSLANRRYLDGYCIANGIVDGYRIPLVWSRFSLKLYLEKVRFSIADIFIDHQDEVNQRYEYYIVGDNADTNIGYNSGAGQVCQSFTPLVSHKITKVKLLIWRQGSPGTLFVSIQTTTGGKPSGVELCSGSINGSALPTSKTWTWIELSGADLVDNTLYAIVCKCPDGDYGHVVNWRFDNTSPTYPRGMMGVSSDYGSQWTMQSARDTMFEEWSYIPAIDIWKATLHVKHPALLKVVHKRGEVSINGYDTLSSFDEEYLTGQVGLDVEKGDYIEATTLPGIKASFTV